MNLLSTYNEQIKSYQCLADDEASNLKKRSQIKSNISTLASNEESRGQNLIKAKKLTQIEAVLNHESEKIFMII